MTNNPYRQVINELEEMLLIARELGVNYEVDPFVTLSFQALPVIPELRLTDKGIFDVGRFDFIKIDENDCAELEVLTVEKN